MGSGLLAVVVATAWFFAWTNGVHDSSNAVATSVSTRALTPRIAVALAGLLNVVGALLGVGVAQTVGAQIIQPPAGNEGLAVVLAGLVGAIAWNLLTWWLGMPSSSSQALIGGLAGAGLVAAVTVDGQTIMLKVVVPMIASPLAGFVLAWALMAILVRAMRDTAWRRAVHRFRAMQTVSAAAVALGHGLQDGQKTMGVIVLALVTAGVQTGSQVPLWVRLSSAVMLGLGTYAGGWRIVRTLGRRVVHVDPVRGFAAESVTAALLYTTAALGAPVSSTHTVTASIAGAGASSGLRSLRWAVLRQIGVVWVVTLPASAALAAACYALGSALARLVG